MTTTTELKKFDITTEEYREYDFGGRIYRIVAPTELYIRSGGSTHRVVDSSGVVHCVPAPGVQGCVLRWRNVNTQVPVNF